MLKIKILRVFFFTVTLLLLLKFSVSALSVAALSMAAAPLITEYALGVSPYNLAVEGAGRIWFTAPAQNVIGLLIYTATQDFTLVTFTVPTTASEPYDLILVGQKVWFTQRSGNKLGELDPTTGNFQEFTIPTANSSPKGLALAPDGSIWFVESNSNKVARFVTATQAFEEYTYPVTVTLGSANHANPRVAPLDPGLADASFEDIAIGKDYSIWLSAPAANQVIYFSNSQKLFFHYGTTPFVKPTSLSLDESNTPWVTVQATTTLNSDLIGRYSPGTLSIWNWYSTPTAGVGAGGLFHRRANGLRQLWFTGPTAGVIGRIETELSTAFLSSLQITLPDGAAAKPWGIVVDGRGDVWIAEAGNGKLARWSAPYFYQSFLPLLAR